MVARMSDFTRTCGHCNGTGRVDLPEHLTDLIELLCRNTALSTSELAGYLCTPQTTLVNRLRELERLGRVECIEGGTNPLWWKLAAPEQPGQPTHREKP